MHLENKLERLCGFFRKAGDMAIAFSGGTDSAFLLAAAMRYSLSRVLAVTVKTPYIQQSVLDQSRAVAEKLRADHLIVTVPEIPEEIMNNPPDRCYHCKRNLFEQIFIAAEKSGMFVVSDGTNSDDPGEYRPGLRAAGELGVVSPLLACGLSKKEIRITSREWNLDTWDLAPTTCLLTRLPYDCMIRNRNLLMIEEAEKAVIAMGFTHVRVRSRPGMESNGVAGGNTLDAVIEVCEKELYRLSEPDVSKQIYKILKKIGYMKVNTDPAGYRQGNMDRENSFPAGVPKEKTGHEND